MADLPLGLRTLLEAPAAEAALEAVLASWRPALRLEENRVGRRSLHPGPIARLFGRGPEPAVLPRIASKYGGVPYLEQEYPTSSGRDCVFIAQLNFAELPTQGLDLPARGLVGFFLNGPAQWETEPIRWLWYPSPDETKARAVPVPRAVLPHEYRITAKPAHAFDFAAVAATFPPRSWPPLLEQLCAWHVEHGGNSGMPWADGLDGDGPRHWCGLRPPVDEHPTALLTLSAHHLCDDLFVSMLAPPARMGAGDFSKLYVLEWQ